MDIVGVESQEQERQSREVVLHFVRHGEAKYIGGGDAEGHLTDRGREQAKKIAEEIYQQLPDGAIIEFLSSNRKRAVETVEAVARKIQELETKQSKNLIFHNDRAKALERLGISGEITQEYLDLIAQRECPIGYWLEHPGKTPDEVQKNLGGFLRHMSRFTQNLSSGHDIHVIFAIHSGPTEVFAGRLLKDPSIGPLANCEQFTIAIPVNGRTAKVNYKDLERQIPL